MLRQPPRSTRPVTHFPCTTLFRSVLPHHAGLRPDWLIRLGLFLYYHLGGRHILPGTRMLDLASDPAGVPLKPVFRRAFEYSDRSEEHTSELQSLMRISSVVF